jgi:hypothetical protein
MLECGAGAGWLAGCLLKRAMQQLAASWLPA